MASHNRGTTVAAGEGKDKLFEKLEGVDRKLDEHTIQCATDKATLTTQMDALTTGILRIEGKLDRLKRGWEGWRQGQ